MIAARIKAVLRGYSLGLASKLDSMLQLIMWTFLMVSVETRWTLFICLKFFTFFYAASDFNTDRFFILKGIAYSLHRVTE